MHVGNKSARFAIFASALALSSAPATASVNLVVNGGFESPSIAPPYLLDVTPTGWIGTGDLVVQGYANAVNSGNGLQWFDLNPNVNAGTGLSQTVSLIAGQAYQFSFVFNGGGGGSTNAISYAVGTDLTGNVSTAALNVYGGSAWKTLNANFVASVTGASILRFSPNGSLSGGFIDNVQLSAVGAPVIPEPASWAMMITGFGLIGGMMRRKNTLGVTKINYA